jgi:hypothetical protein
LDENGVPLDVPIVQPNTFFSDFLDEDVDSVYIVIDQMYLNKNTNEFRIQLDYYKSKNSRNKGRGLLNSVNIYSVDKSLFIAQENAFKIGYTIAMESINSIGDNDELKFISD